MSKKRVSMWYTEELIERLDKIAKYKGINRTALALMVLTEYTHENSGLWESKGKNKKK